MASSRHPGFDALVKCEDQVKRTIKDWLTEIAKFLKNIKIIDHTLYNDVTNPESTEIADEKAKKLYMKLLDKVESDEDYYLKFVGFLRKKPLFIFKKTVARLDEAYTGNGKSIIDKIINKNPNSSIHTGGIKYCLSQNWKNI